MHENGRICRTFLKRKPARQGQSWEKGKKVGSNFNSTEYKNKFTREKYDRIGLVVKKGRKEELKARAESQGLSLNEYINRLIDNDDK